MLLVLATAAGCTTTTGQDAAAGTTADTATGAVPEFTGPYAAEFADTYRTTDSDFVRETLADSQISDAEYAEMTERFRQCLADVGITFNGFDRTGAYTTSLAPNPDDTYDLVQDCVASSGQDSIGMLHDLMATNPGNRDIGELMAECLVRSGAVPGDYAADDYVADKEGRFQQRDALPDALREALTACSRDPQSVG